MKNTTTPVKITQKIKYNFICKGQEGQDGAIFGDFLFRFKPNGTCFVYSVEKMQEISTFKLDKSDILAPHSNVVCFGNEYFDPSDEFPVLYSNIYNNYSDNTDRLEGMCCVYRIVRDGESFSSTLIQTIRIGFVEDLDVWKSLPDNKDYRPYGNFVVDVENSKLFAFVLRDKEHITRFFEFSLPIISDGEYCEKYGVKNVTLNLSDIKAQFDLSRSYYIQGACCYDNKIFSVEGGTASETNTVAVPRMKIIDTVTHTETVVELCELGLKIEPELIDFAGDTIYYMDAAGDVYTFEFIAE